jgi:hypothetical protein
MAANCEGSQSPPRAVEMRKKKKQANGMVFTSANSTDTQESADRFTKVTKENEMQIREEKTKHLKFLKGRRLPKNESIQMGPFQIF